MRTASDFSTVSREEAFPVGDDIDGMRGCEAAIKMLQATTRSNIGEVRSGRGLHGMRDLVNAFLERWWLLARSYEALSKWRRHSVQRILAIGGIFSQKQ
jgi:hypothetical protein